MSELTVIFATVALYFAAPFFFPCEANFYAHLPERLSVTVLLSLFWWGAIMAYRKAAGY